MPEIYNFDRADIQDQSATLEERHLTADELAARMATRASLMNVYLQALRSGNMEEIRNARIEILRQLEVDYASLPVRVTPELENSISNTDNDNPATASSSADGDRTPLVRNTRRRIRRYKINLRFSTSNQSRTELRERTLPPHYSYLQWTEETTRSLLRERNQHVSSRPRSSNTPENRDAEHTSYSDHRRTSVPEDEAYLLEVEENTERLSSLRLSM